ncbi:phospholipase A1 PLIP2, chloroplastic [Cryptomeria japonica]|uniref:phospholipase A1 PLIP2, chloroplastic n=1 Tax=Cryptomeria japonica TaxID=3369 RepID=UPI0027D9D836|nr:phospholipase A1 PLIP2, chloroplastic [Cryptomeria japonica]
MDALAWKTMTGIGREACTGTKSRDYSTAKNVFFELGLKCQAKFKSCRNPVSCPPISSLFSPPFVFPGSLKFIWINKTSEGNVEGSAKTELEMVESRDGFNCSACGALKTSQQIQESNAEEEENAAGDNGFLSSDDSLKNLDEKSSTKLNSPFYNPGAQGSEGSCISPNENKLENPDEYDRASHMNWVGRMIEFGSYWNEQNKCDPNSSSNGASTSRKQPCLSQQADCSSKMHAGNNNPNHPHDGCNGDDDFLCSLRKQVSINEVTHDRDSFSRLLYPVSLSETKIYAQMSFLCDQAYSIPQIKPAELWKLCHLHFVTSSLDKTAETISKIVSSVSTANPDLQSMSISSETGEEGNSRRNDGTNSRLSVNPSVAYEIAVSAASYILSQTKCILPFKSERRNQADNDGNLNSGTKQDAEDIAVEQKASYTGTQQTFTDSQHAKSTKLSSMSKSDTPASMDTSSITTLVDAEEVAKQKAAKDSQSLHSPLCEWFICDDDSSHTRYCVIQGSNSLASWQTNLFFEPTKFEGFEVLVHKGIYEAAKGMYEQLMPKILSHLRRHGEDAKFRFIGHSLGGSLSLLLNLMLLIREVASKTSLLPVITFGSPCVMCGGDYLLQKLGLPNNHVQAVMMHRDIVPRSFACNYPDHVTEVLKRLHISFRDHPCLNSQKFLYGSMGQPLILQPDENISPPHPLLPSGCGFYTLCHVERDSSEPKNELSGTLQELSGTLQVQAAQNAFLNTPHPLEILSDRGAYGSRGSISRDHDSGNYFKAINCILRQQIKHVRILHRKQRRQEWRPLVTADSSMSSKMPSKVGKKESKMSEDLMSFCK